MLVLKNLILSMLILTMNEKRPAFPPQPASFQIHQPTILLPVCQHCQPLCTYKSFLLLAMYWWLQKTPMTTLPLRMLKMLFLLLQLTTIIIHRKEPQLYSNRRAERNEDDDLLSINLLKTLCAEDFAEMTRNV